MIARLCLVLATLCLAGNITIGRVLADAVPPATLTALRWTVALIVLAPLAAAQMVSLRTLMRERFGWFVMMAATGVVGVHGLIYLALGYTTATNVALIMGATPSAMLVISYLKYGERHGPVRLLGVAICFAGIVTLVAGKLALPGIGDAIACIGMPCWAYYSVAIRDKPAEIDGIALTFGVSVFGLALLAPLVAGEAIAGLTVDWSMNVVLGVLFIGVFSSGVAYVMWSKGISMIGSATAAPFMNLVAVFGVLLGIVALGEPFTLRHAIASGLIGVGLVLSQLQRETVRV